MLVLQCCLSSLLMRIKLWQHGIVYIQNFGSWVQGAAAHAIQLQNSAIPSAVIQRLLNITFLAKLYCSAGHEQRSTHSSDISSSSSPLFSSLPGPPQRFISRNRICEVSAAAQNSSSSAWRLCRWATSTFAAGWRCSSICSSPVNGTTARCSYMRSEPIMRSNPGC